MRGANPTKTGRSRHLRRGSTDAEMKLWHHLRSRSLCATKFVRQQPVGPFIVDFACREHRLIIEVDGSQHAESPKDKARDAFLRSQGYRVLRFWNNDVLTNTAGVLETIANALAALQPPHPPRCARRPLPASGER